MLISDIVQLNDEAGLENDVQLGWYPNDLRSGRLARRFIFTDKAVEGKHSSIDILQKVQQGFLYPVENRFVAIASYGHGKTHFALAMANYFGLPFNSPEVVGILDNIEHASPSRAAAFRSFREARRPYLVIVLSGDRPVGLMQQYLKSLDAVLAFAVRSVEELPHWFTGAEKYFVACSDSEKSKINERLISLGNGVDFSLMMERLVARDPTVYAVCKEASAVLNHGLPVDFGGEIALEELVTLTIDTFCGEGKLYEGLVVLFDEFASFIKRVAIGDSQTSDAGLQDLLNGVSNRKGKAVFIAFSQHDPDTVADNALAKQSSDQRESLKRELNRLPRECRYLLHSSMETVLDSFLRQAEAPWLRLCEECPSAIVDASDHAMTLFPERYDSVKGWSDERVANILTKGCFPLHPVTTAIMCSVNMRDVASPRPVLGFVKDALDKCRADEAYVSGEPRWIRPIELVDWFKDMLADVEYKQYQSALQQVGADASPEVRAVLKAILLQMTAQIKLRRRRYDWMVSILTGMSIDVCNQTLTWLAEAGNGYIRHDTAQNTYIFWPIGAGGHQIEQYVSERIAGKSLNNVIDEINVKWPNNDRLKPTEHQIDWAAAKDYSSKQMLLTKGTFIVEKLRAAVPVYDYNDKIGVTDGVRGCVIWLVPTSTDEVIWFRDNAQLVLDSAFSDPYPVPVVLALCPESRPKFQEAVLREREIVNMSPEDLQKFGGDVYQETKKSYSKYVEDELTSIRSSPEIIVQSAYKNHIAACNPGNNPQTVIRRCYDAAYPSHVPGFFGQYNDKKLKPTVETLAKKLCYNSLPTLESHAGIQGELTSKYLRIGASASWTLVGHNDILQIPTNSRIKEAWDCFDEIYSPGQQPARPRLGLLKLLNAPFGFTYSQAVLLFCAWFGYNRRFLSLQSGAAPDSLDNHFGRLSAGAMEFISDLSDPMITLRRRDPGEEARRIAQRMSNAAKNPMLPTGAVDYVKELNEFKKTGPDDDMLVGQVDAEIQAVRESLAQYKSYKEQAVILSNAIKLAKDLDSAIARADEVTKLSKPKRIVVEEDIAPSVLSMAARQRISDMVKAECSKLATLTDIESFGFNHQCLEAIRAKVIGASRTDLKDEVAEAIKKLTANRDRLHERQQDKTIVAQLDMIQSPTSLSDARMSVSQLRGFQAVSEEIRGLLADRIMKIDEFIAKEESWLREIPARIDSSSTLSALDSLYKALLQKGLVFDNASEKPLVAEALTRIDVLKDSFVRVSQIPTDPISPKEFEEAKRELAEISSNLAKTGSPLQRNVIKEIEEAINRNVQKHRETAVRWLSDLALKQEQGTSLSFLMSTLRQTQPWLPKECEGELKALRTSVQNRVDASEVETVVQHFEAITDSATRQACLIRLGEIMLGEGK